MSYDYQRYIDSREKELLSFDVNTYEDEDDYHDDKYYTCEMIGIALKSVAQETNELLLLAHNIGWQAKSASMNYTLDTDTGDFMIGLKFIEDTCMKSFSGLSIYAQEDTFEDVKYFNLVCYTHDCNMVITVMPKTGKH